jgi:hypothetical protein
MPTKAKRERRRTSRERMCKRKRPLSPFQAVAYLEDLRLRCVEGFERLEIFPCWYCSTFHVGHSPARVSPLIRLT